MNRQHSRREGTIALRGMVTVGFYVQQVVENVDRGGTKPESQEGQRQQEPMAGIADLVGQKHGRPQKDVLAPLMRAHHPDYRLDEGGPPIPIDHMVRIRPLDLLDQGCAGRNDVRLVSLLENGEVRM